MNKKHRFVTIGEARAEYGEGYKYEIDRFLRDVALSYDDPLVMITEEHIKHWVKVMESRNLKPASIKHYLVALRVFINRCGLDLKIKTPRIQTEQLKFYTEDEIKLLLKVDRTDYVHHRTYCIIAFILSTGARASTVVNIKLEDIDWKNKEVYYRHLKNKKTAIIPLPDSLIKILKDFLNDWEVTEYLFPDRFDRQLTVSALRQAHNRYCVERGVKPRSVHALRHTFAREYIKNGGDAFTLMKFLTHSTIEMSAHYVHLFSDDLRVATHNYVPLTKLLPERKPVIQRRF